MPPKFAVYEKANTDECKAEIEKGLAKLRWTKRKQVEKGDKDKPKSGESQDLNGERERTIYHVKSKTFDFLNMRATDLPFNQRVHLPDPLDDESEIAIQNLKAKLNQITEEYVKSEKFSKWSNLEKDEREGLVSLKKKVETQESVVFQTDKSGRFSLDSLENYKTVSQPHIRDSVVITKDKHDRLQQLINAHSVSWVPILDAGKETNNEVRIKNNMLNSDSQVAPLYSLHKDHKEYNNEYSGPPVRPVCGAVVGYNCKLSHIVSVLLAEVWKSKENSAICMSTEDMIAEMNSVNQNQEDDNLIIGSTDVVALYPSLDIEFTIDRVCEVFFESNVSVRGTDDLELGLYLQSWTKFLGTLV